MSKPPRPGGDSDQPRFPFPEAQPRLDDVAISPANEAAVRLLRRSDKWPFPVLCLIGEEGAGLSTLARAWVLETGGEMLDAAAFDRLRPNALTELAGSCAAIDRADQIKEEAALLTLLNTVQSSDGTLLLTARKAPPLWRVSSRDLSSRLASMQTVEIGPPDEDIFRARLQAAARKRFLKLNDDLVDYLAIRVDFKYTMIEEFVRRLDEAVTKTGRAPSIPLARSVLEEGQATRPLFDDD